MLIVIFFFKQKTAYEISACLVGSEMCIRDRSYTGHVFIDSNNLTVGGDICGHNLYIQDISAQNLYIQDISAQNITANVFREPFISPHTTFVVTVLAKTTNHRYYSPETNAYFIDGIESPYIDLLPGRTYKFDQSDSTNAVSYTHLTLPTNREV